MMLNVCDNCGQYRADKIIDPSGPYAICPLCEHRHPFRLLPLLTVCGPSAGGKSTVARLLTGQLDTVVTLDADILWRPEFDTPDNAYRDFFETWLRLGKNINQSGRPLVLFGAGCIPENIEPCVERRYFSELRCLALVCADEVLTRRLQQRPEWRESHRAPFIAEQLRFNRWLGERAASADSTIEVLDTGHVPVEATVAQVAGWISTILGTGDSPRPARGIG